MTLYRYTKHSGTNLQHSQEAGPDVVNPTLSHSVPTQLLHPGDTKWLPNHGEIQYKVTQSIQLMARHQTSTQWLEELEIHKDEAGELGLRLIVQWGSQMKTRLCRLL